MRRVTIKLRSPDGRPIPAGLKKETQHVRNLLYLPKSFKTQPEPQPQCAVDLSLWIREDLSEFESAWDVAFDILIRDIFEDFIATNWDFKHGRPKKLRWQQESEKKPRVNGACKKKIFKRRLL